MLLSPESGQGRQVWADRCAILGSLILCAALPVKLQAMFAGLALLLLSMILQPRQLKWPGLLWGTAFGLWCHLTSCLAAGTCLLKPDGMVWLWITFPLLASALAQRPRLQLWCLGGLALTTGLSALLAELQFVIGCDPRCKPWRISTSGQTFWKGVGFHYPHLTQGFVIGMSLLILALPGQGSLRWLGRIGGAAAFLLVNTRSAIIGLLVGIGMWWVTPSGRRRLATALLVTSLLALVSLGGLWLIAPDRLTSMLHGDDGRWRIWAVSADMVAERPLTGHGQGKPYEHRFLALAEACYGPDGFDSAGKYHAHNVFLALSAAHGLPAPLLYLGFLGSIGLVAWRRRRQDPAAAGLVGGAITFTLAMGQFEHVARDSESIMALMTALAFGHARLAYEPNKDQSSINATHSSPASAHHCAAEYRK